MKLTKQMVKRINIEQDYKDMCNLLENITAEDLKDEETVEVMHIIEAVICPQCGWEAKEEEGSVKIDIEPYDGVYCLRCWAKWLSENLPKMERKKKS
jgi:hypothetical protein